MSSSVQISLDTRVAASKDLVACRVDDEVVILSMQTGEYYGLDPVAASIWDAVQEPTSVVAVRDELMARYDGMTIEECTEQLIGLLKEMAALSLVELH